MDEVKARDHRTSGGELKIFILDEFAGREFASWLPNGHLLKEKISTYLKKEFNEYGFSLDSTPILGSKVMYTTSEHRDVD